MCVVHGYTFIDGFSFHFFCVCVCYNVIGLTGYRAVVDGAMRRMPFNVPK